ncbi:MAG: hypothetical protein OXC92_03000 [Flavobacteriaceae bacterium]|nr:hypothetical protein [Flavobacteriaceae bacterium]MCY4215937.1 hypothetical protein [Flavobacteriaceae bacterium]
MGRTARLGIQGFQGVFKIRPVDRISQPLDLVFWMENGIEFRVESLGLFGGYFLDHFYQILSTIDAFLADLKTRMEPFNPPYKKTGGYIWAL